MASEFERVLRSPRELPTSRTERSLLRMQVSYRSGFPMVYLSGELDHHSAGELRAVIEQELSAGATGLLLETSELRYIDSGGLSLLFDTLHRLEDTGGLGIVGPNEGVGKLMELTGLVDRPGFHIFPDLASVGATVAQLLGAPRPSLDL